MGADHQLVDQPAEMLAVDAEMRSAPSRRRRRARMFSSQYSAASRAKRSARSSSTPDGGAVAAGLLAEHVGEDGAEVDRGAGRLRDLAGRLARGRLHPRRTGARWRCGNRSRAARCRRSAAPPISSPNSCCWMQDGQPAQHGVHQVALLGARIAVGGAVEAGQPVDQAADLDLELAAHLGALDRRIAHRGQALDQVGHAAVVGPEGLVPGPRRIGEMADARRVVDEVAAQLAGARRRRSRRCPSSRPSS